MNEEQKYLVTLLKQAVAHVYQEQRFLLTTQGASRKGLEQAFVFRTGLYMYQLLKRRSQFNFDSLDLDCEYNKNFGDPKVTPRFSNGIRPDLLLHQRNSNERNKLAVEFKGWWNGGVRTDIMKLEDLTNPDAIYRYSLGILVRIGRLEPKYRVFIGGREDNYLG